LGEGGRGPRFLDVAHGGGRRGRSAEGLVTDCRRRGANRVGRNDISRGARRRSSYSGRLTTRAWQRNLLLRRRAVPPRPRARRARLLPRPARLDDMLHRFHHTFGLLQKTRRSRSGGDGSRSSGLSLETKLLAHRTRMVRARGRRYDLTSSGGDFLGSKGGRVDCKERYMVSQKAEERGRSNSPEALALAS